MYMFVQVVNGIGIRVDNLLHVLWAHFVLHPGACAGYEALRLELIGIQQISTQRLGIIRFV
jgi:hypothetical protein